MMELNTTCGGIVENLARDTPNHRQSRIIRRKKQRHASTSLTNFDSTKFWNENAANQYTTLVGKSLTKERGITIERQYGTLFDLATARRWMKFIEQPCDAVVSLVREFYANLKIKHKGLKVRVRGKKVAFDSHTINSMYFMPEFEHDQYTTYLEQNLDYHEIITRLCHEGAMWKTNASGEVLTFSASMLQRDERAWFNFVSARMMPSTHTSDVTKERAALVYCIVTNKTIDVGRVIQASILNAVKGASTGGLPHPSLITNLCQQAGVVWHKDEEVLKPHGPINLGKIMEPDPPRTNQEGPSNSTQPQNRPPRPSTAQMTNGEKLALLEQHIMYQQQQMDSHHRQAYAFMSYLTEFTTVLAQRFPSSSPDEPQFPPPPVWPPLDDNEGDDH